MGPNTSSFMMSASSGVFRSATGVNDGAVFLDGVIKGIVARHDLLHLELIDAILPTDAHQWLPSIPLG